MKASQVFCRVPLGDPVGTGRVDCHSGERLAFGLWGVQIDREPEIPRQLTQLNSIRPAE